MTDSHTVRVRFAPSPTGFLHVGGARTALFNFLYARASGGKFLLRIEDTDRERSEPRFTEDILESLKWLGLNWDEEPVFQSNRFPRYQAVAQQLLDRGLAYRCDCTSEALEAYRAQCEREKKPFRYPGTCRTKTSVSSPHVVRIRIPEAGETGFNDLIRGQITFQNKDIDDWVILRSDGSPTYNFCVVIDDSDQGITHILRGDDHINNTPKQILLYQALGLKVPNFAHLPMILGADRTKLSKRHGAASTLEYRNMGYLPEALINFLVRLGWSHGDQEIFTPEELQRIFSLDKIGKANAVFSTDKLNWISGHWLRETPAAKLVPYLRKHFSAQLSYPQPVDDTRLEKGVAIVQGKVKSCLELIEQMQCLFGADPNYDTASLKPGEAAAFRETLQAVKPVLEASSFDKTDLETRVRARATEMNQKLTPFAQSIRFAVTGGKVSPSLFEMLEVQTKPVVMRRLEKAISVLAEVAGS